jgi:hypothetical protein
MLKTAAEQIKLAHLYGNAVALTKLGFSAEQTCECLIKNGSAANDAELLTKEAFGMVAKGLGFLGGKMMPAIAKGLAGAAPRVTQMAGHGMLPGAAQRAMTWGGGAAQRAGQAMTTAGQGMATNPLATMGAGAKNFFFGGKGIGGAMGKSMTAYGLGSALMG